MGKYTHCVYHFPLSRPDENYLAVAAAAAAVVPERVPGATNGGNLSPTALRVLLAPRPFFHPPSRRTKGRILALAKSVVLTFASFIIAAREGG